MPVSTLMTTVRKIVRDPSPGIAWTDVDYLRFANDAQRNAAVLRPDLFTVRGPIPLVAGTLQAIPATGTLLMRIDENAGGLRVRLIDSDVLDSALLAWPQVAANALVLEYATDRNDRKRFHVFPPNTGTGSVIALYGINPPELVDPADLLSIDDQFAPAVREFMLAQAFGFVTPKGDMNRALVHQKQAETILGINAKTEAEAKPKYAATPGGA